MPILTERTCGAAVCGKMGIVAQVRSFWKRFSQGKPGRRFQDEHDRSKVDRSKQHLGLRILKIVGAVVAIALGVAEAILPGPAILFFALGGGLLATEFEFAARFMDWSEVRIRKLWNWGRRRWRRFPPGARHAAVGAVLCMALASAFVMYRVVWR